MMVLGIDWATKYLFCTSYRKWHFMKNYVTASSLLHLGSVVQLTYWGTHGSVSYISNCKPIKTVSKRSLQVTDPLVTNTGSKQEAFWAERLQTRLLPQAELKQNRTEQKVRDVKSHHASFHKPTPAQDKACGLIQSEKWLSNVRQKSGVPSDELFWQKKNKTMQSLTNG